MKLGKADDKRLIELYVKLEFNSFLKKLNIEYDVKEEVNFFEPENSYEISDGSDFSMHR